MEGEDPDAITGSDDAEDEEEAIGDFSQYPRLHPSRTRSNTLCFIRREGIDFKCEELGDKREG